MSVRRSLDGMVTGDSFGRAFRVFEPAWWQVWRWVEYWRADSRGKIDVAFVGGLNVRVRVIAHKRRLQRA